MFSNWFRRAGDVWGDPARNLIKSDDKSFAKSDAKPDARSDAYCLIKCDL